MYQKQKILAIIPARGETKNIFKKNTKLFNEYPLFTWVLKAAINSNYIDNIIVSTEDDEIIQISNTFGNFIPFKRDLSLSKDNTSLNLVIIDILKNLKEKELEYDYILTLLPTQPLIQSFHLDEMIKMTLENNFNSSIGVLKENSKTIRIVNNNQLENFNKTIYKINNSIFINKVSSISPDSFNLYNNKFPFIIDEKFDGNINSPLDWEISELKQLLIEYQKI